MQEVYSTSVTWTPGPGYHLLFEEASQTLLERLRSRQLSEAQLDGRACVACGREDTTTIPFGTFDGGQVFICDAAL